MKRFDHVAFTEVFDLSPYVYCKRSVPKLRPKTLDVDPTSRLVGGRTNISSSSLRSTTYVRSLLDYDYINTFIKLTFFTFSRFC